MSTSAAARPGSSRRRATAWPRCCACPSSTRRWPSSCSAPSRMPAGSGRRATSSTGSPARARLMMGGDGGHPPRRNPCRADRQTPAPASTLTRYPRCKAAASSGSVAMVSTSSMNGRSAPRASYVLRTAAGVAGDQHVAPVAVAKDVRSRGSGCRSAGRRVRRTARRPHSGRTRGAGRRGEARPPVRGRRRSRGNRGASTAPGRPAMQRLHGAAQEWARTHREDLRDGLRHGGRRAAAGGGRRRTRLPHPRLVGRPARMSRCMAS